jgi:sugar lactone lactonase YvrE
MLTDRVSDDDSVVVLQRRTAVPGAHGTGVRLAQRVRCPDTMRIRMSRWGVALAAAAALGGCGGGATATPTPTPSASPSPAVSTPTAAPTPTATPAATLASCAPAVGAGGLHVLHHFTESPDDIAVDSAGLLWVTSTPANLLFNLSPDGSVLSTQTVAAAPEGIAFNGSAMYVAQQNLNAIETVTPLRQTLVTFPNRTSNMGVDGIGLDAAHGRLLVPDSPTGQLYAVPLSGSPTPQLLASNLGRPVAAATDAAGDIYVASESSPALTELTASGGRKAVGQFTDLDEVVLYGGLLYVTELDRHDVVAIDPATGASVVIASGLPAPQGLAATETGTLEIVDATNNTLYSMPACGVSA